MIELRVNGNVHGGWKDARVTRSIDRACGDFSMTVSERYPGQASNMDIRPGDQCTVQVNGQTVITGYVDEVKPKGTHNTHDVEFSGRSRTQDLVDCSVVHKSGQWTGRPLSAIARDIVAPFGIGLELRAPANGIIPDFQLTQGETAFNAIERLCAMQALLVCDDARGNLVITRSGNARASGQIRLKTDDASRNRNNVLSYAGNFSWRERFSRYIIKGQSAGTDNWFGAAASSIQAEVADTGVNRYRPLIVLAETQVGGASAQERAAWERSTRRGKSIGVEYKVQGWTQDTDGNLWMPNTMVPVDDDVNQVHGELLVVSCSWEAGTQGSTTTIKVAPAEAYDVLRETNKGYQAKWADLRSVAPQR